MRVYTAGTFDLFHAGHVELLRRCKELGDVVTVVLNTDKFVEEYKGCKPVLSFSERKKVLESCRYVDRVIPNTGEDKCWNTIAEDSTLYNPTVVIGSDWACKDYAKQMGVCEVEKEYFYSRVVYVPYTEGISTTEIKRRICDQQSQ